MRNIMWRGILVLLLSISFNLVFAQNRKTKDNQYKSLLWEITGNGLTKPSYLYGTMHVSSKLAFNLADSFFVCLKNSDAIALETSPEEWLDGMEKNRTLFQYSPEGYNSYGGDKIFYQKAFEFNLPVKKKLEQMLKTDLSIMNSVLYRSNTYNSNYEEDTYLDFFIYQSGKRLGKEVYSLEDYEVSREMSRKAQWPSKIKKTKIPIFSGYSNVKLEDAYRKGDLNALDSIQRLGQTNENFYKYLLYDRNIIMANNMDSIMKVHSLFSGVGAAHLPGEKGMIELLRKKGYKLRPVKFNDIKESELKVSIDKTKYPVVFSKKYSPDSVFAVETPFKLYQLQATNDHYLYVSPDLPNGCYYMIKRMPHYSQLSMESTEVLFKRIDSLIYENVPGKITERKNIQLSPSGYKAIDITNKTRRGDVHKCRIIITPTEIIYLQVRGNGLYVSETDLADKFINSFEFITNPSLLTKAFIAPSFVTVPSSKPVIKKFTAPNNGFSVSTFANASFNSETPYGYSYYAEVLTASDPKTENIYLVKKRILLDYSYIESDTFELNILSENISASAKLDIFNRKLIKWQGYPAVEFSARNKDKNVFLYGMLVLRGGEYYLVAHYGKNKNRDNDFFKSFSLNPYKYNYTLKDFEDKELFFKVKAIDLPTRNKNASLYNTYNNMFEDRYYENYKASVMEKAVVCPQTGEQVNITFAKFHKYYNKIAIDTFWKHRVEILGVDKKLVNKNYKFENKGDHWVATASFTDTGSVKTVITKMILKKGALYTLAYLTDSLTQESKFVKDVIASFSPSDTIFDNNIFDDKIGQLLEDIYSKDSTTAANAKSSIEYTTAYFKDEDAPRLAKAFMHPSFAAFTMTNKVDLIKCAVAMKDSVLLEPFKTVYLANDDSVKVQIAILTILSQQKTKASYRLIGELLRTDAPVISDSYLFERIIENLSDSIELCNDIYSDLLLLSGIREYEFSIIDLIARLNNSNNQISEQMYLKIKDSFINKANLEVKRQRAKKSNEYSSYLKTSDENILNYLNSTEKIDFNFERELHLYNYLSVLIRSYNEPSVKAIFDKTLQIKNDFLQLSVSALLLKFNHPVNDTIWEHYAKKDQTRLLVYAELKQIGKLSKIPAKYMTQESFCRGALYNDDKSSENDTITFFNKYKVYTKGKPGYAYCFKRKNEDGEIAMDIIAAQNIDAKTIVDKELVFYSSGNIDRSKNQKEEIDIKLENIFYKYRVESRRRAPANSYKYTLDRDSR